MSCAEIWTLDIPFSNLVYLTHFRYSGQVVPSVVVYKCVELPIDRIYWFFLENGNVVTIPGQNKTLQIHNNI